MLTFGTQPPYHEKVQAAWGEASLGVQLKRNGGFKATIWVEFPVASQHEVANHECESRKVDAPVPCWATLTLCGPEIVPLNLIWVAHFWDLWGNQMTVFVLSYYGLLHSNRNNKLRMYRVQVFFFWKKIKIKEKFSIFVYAHGKISINLGWKILLILL